MSILIGIGIVTSVTTFYLMKKGWRAFHKAVGIRPGVLTYQDYHAPLSLSTLSWQQLKLDKNYLKNLSQQQLRQLQRIDEKVNSYHAYQQVLKESNKTQAISEAQFVLHKMLHTRLPEMLASYNNLTHINKSTSDINNEKRVEAHALLQKMLNSIEQRLDALIEQMEAQQLQDLRIMDNYFNSHDS